MSVIEVKELVKQYDKAKAPAVKGIDFSVEEGEFFAFLGPNGAGKTTTISILTTTLSKTAGQVHIAGLDVGRDAKRVREKVGIIFQQPSLDLNLTAEQNIRFHACLYGMYTYRPTFSLMPAEYKKRVLELAEIVDIGNALFRPIKKLSGGMQRKLEIIRSLIHTPRVLFLDEPTQGLDAMSRRGLWEYINNMRKQNGTTVFLTTHYIDEAESVDTVCIINHGEIAACSSPEEMKQSLLRQELIVDATDRAALVRELASMGLPYQTEAHIRVPYQSRTAQDIIGRLQTPLSMLKIHEPSLEDAYIDFLNRGGATA